MAREEGKGGEGNAEEGQRREEERSFHTQA
jgi:hypothetical protein